jgi:hypothetical protein
MPSLTKTVPNGTTLNQIGKNMNNLNTTTENTMNKISVPNGAIFNQTGNLMNTYTSADETSMEIATYSLNRSGFVKKFNSYAAKTALATIEMCRVAFDAKHILSKEDFKKFCADIGMKESPSTIRKYLAIGEAADRFIAYADYMPNSWTVIYLITQMPADTFAKCMEIGMNFGEMTGTKIKELIEASTGNQATLPPTTPSFDQPIGNGISASSADPSDSVAVDPTNGVVEGSTGDATTDEEDNKFNTAVEPEVATENNASLPDVVTDQAAATVDADHKTTADDEPESSVSEPEKSSDEPNSTLSTQCAMKNKIPSISATFKFNRTPRTSSLNKLMEHIKNAVTYLEFDCEVEFKTF